MKRYRATIDGRPLGRRVRGTSPLFALACVVERYCGPRMPVRALYVARGTAAAVVAGIEIIIREED
jgi:hypothetical protein